MGICSNVLPRSVYFQQKYKNIKKKKLMKILIFTAENNLCILYGQVFVMYASSLRGNIDTDRFNFCNKNWSSQHDVFRITIFTR